jgi:phage FluMu protein Com
MSVNQEGIGTLKLECPQSHPVGRILKEAPHQQVVYDPGAQVGPRRFWPDEEDQPQFTIRCRQCDKPVSEATTALQDKHRNLIMHSSETFETATLPFV